MSKRAKQSKSDDAELRACELCGCPFPTQVVEDVRTCMQWSEAVVRNLPDPSDFSVILSVNLVVRTCILFRRIEHVVLPLVELQN